MTFWRYSLWPFAAGASRAAGLAATVLFAAMLGACGSTDGEDQGAFPDLRQVPDRPQTASPEELAYLKEQLKAKRDQINWEAADLLRGGTGAVPIALAAEIPRAPKETPIPPAAMPATLRLPAPPERPVVLPISLLRVLEPSLAPPAARDAEPGPVAPPPKEAMPAVRAPDTKK